MTASHTLNLSAIPEFEELQALLVSRASEVGQNSPIAHSSFEENVVDLTMAIAARIIADDAERHDVNAPGLIHDGVSYRQKHRAERTYMSSAGPIRILRWVYVERGGHGGKTFVPLEAKLGIVGQFWTQRAAEVGCNYMEETTSRRSCELLKLHKGMTPSASSLDRLPKLIGAMWEENRVELEEAVRAAEELPPEDEIKAILTSDDGVMMRKKDGELTDDGKVTVAFKEAGCGTLALLNADGERKKTVKMARMPEPGKKTLVEIMAGEMKRAKEAYPSVTWVAISDGAKSNWKIFEDLSRDVGVPLFVLLDFWHAMEHLAEALNQVQKLSLEDRAAELARWKKDLQEKCHGPKQLIRRLEELRAMVRCKGRLKNLDREIKYFRSNHEAGRMRWAKARAAGLPIGSGIQEAGCKTLVVERMKRSGMSWLTPGGQSILTLRALQQSGRLALAFNALAPYFSTEFQIDPNPQRKRPNYAAAA